ncbi:MAG TPA: hypothetical protein VF959_07150 [Casimicrobiaceae bacterium]
MTFAVSQPRRHTLGLRGELAIRERHAERTERLAMGEVARGVANQVDNSRDARFLVHAFPDMVGAA